MAVGIPWRVFASRFRILHKSVCSLFIILLLLHILSFFFRTLAALKTSRFNETEHDSIVPIESVNPHPKSRWITKLLPKNLVLQWLQLEITSLQTCTKKNAVFLAPIFFLGNFTMFFTKKKGRYSIIFEVEKPFGPSVLVLVKTKFQGVGPVAMPQQRARAPRLSMDNLVVFSLIMTTYRVPACLTRKVWILLVVCGWWWTWRCGKSGVYEKIPHILKGIPKRPTKKTYWQRSASRWYQMSEVHVERTGTKRCVIPGAKFPNSGGTTSSCQFPLLHRKTSLRLDEWK